MGVHPSGKAAGSKSFVSRLVAGAIVLAVGAGGGAVLGTLDPATPASAQVASRVASYGESELEPVVELVVENSAPPAAAAPAPEAPKTTVRRVVKVVAAAEGSARVPAGAAAVPKPPGGQPSCDRLDDGKIEWLRGLVGETRESNPILAPVAAGIDSYLATGLGRNMCAAEAQAHLNALCADRAVWGFMQKMVKELPFFVRPLVGDPCKQDIVKAAQRYLP